MARSKNHGWQARNDSGCKAGLQYVKFDPDIFQFDLDQVLSSIVPISSRIPEDAMTASLLGVGRADRVAQASDQTEVPERCVDDDLVYLLDLSVEEPVDRRLGFSHAQEPVEVGRARFRGGLRGRSVAGVTGARGCQPPGWESAPCPETAS